MKYDYLIVGAGPFGAAFAHRVAESGRRALVIDRRYHVAGNCYTECVDGVHVHRHGEHIFFTANADVWQFVQQFSRFRPYRHRAQVVHAGRTYPFPIDLQTLRQVWGVQSPEEAAAKLEKVRQRTTNARSLEGWLLSQIGDELYTMFFRDYTRKQWGREPADLPASIVRRIPIRTTENDLYHRDTTRFTGIPIGGYTRLFSRMLDHPRIRMELGADFLARRDYWQRQARYIVYSGKIDSFFECEYGALDYRSLRFHDERRCGWHQEVAVVNYADADVPFTRVVEHKHFEPTETSATIVTWVYPEEHTAGNDPHYPIRDRRNMPRLRCYLSLARTTPVVFGGRLGSYQYLNMDQTIAQALRLADRHMVGAGFCSRSVEVGV